MIQVYSRKEMQLKGRKMHTVQRIENTYKMLKKSTYERTNSRKKKLK